MMLIDYFSILTQSVVIREANTVIGSEVDGLAVFLYVHLLYKQWFPKFTLNCPNEFQLLSTAKV